MNITGKSLRFHTAYIDLPQIFFLGGAYPGACRILVSQPGIRPAVETKSLNHWTIREVPCLKLLCVSLLYFYHIGYHQPKMETLGNYLFIYLF